MTRAVNAFVVVVVLGTALGVRAVHESQVDERRRLREGVARDAERLRARRASVTPRISIILPINHASNCVSRQRPNPMDEDE